MAHVVTSEIERSTAESVFVERDVAKHVFRLCRPGKHAAFAQSLVLAVVYLQAVEIIVASQELLVHHATEVEVHAPIGVGGHVACVVSQQEADTGTEVLIAFVRAAGSFVRGLVDKVFGRIVHVIIVEVDLRAGKEIAFTQAEQEPGVDL